MFILLIATALACSIQDAAAVASNGLGKRRQQRQVALTASSKAHSTRAEVSDPGVEETDWLAAPTEESLKEDYSGDWLFHVKTTSCHGDAFDNGTYTLASRIFLPILCAGCVWIIVRTARGQTEKSVDDVMYPGPPIPDDSGETAGHQQILDAEPSAEGNKRLWHLDFARICAVMCVIFEHSGGLDYTHRNVGFGLWWALPYLYMTSGMGSMMSKSSMWGYILRLLCVFAVGVGANWFADACSHRDWQHDFGNTIFQMFFVIMLIIMAPLAEPLRQALRWRQNHPVAPVSSWTTGFTLFWGLVSTISMSLFARGYTGDSHDIVSETFESGEIGAWMKFYAPVLRHSPIIVVHVGGTLFLSLLATMVCHPDNTGLVGWVLLFFTYAQMIVIPWDQDSFPHLICLNIFAMVTTVWPLSGGRTIARQVQAYWPFLLMFLCLDSMPDMWGRCDVHSPYFVWERFRMFLGEFTLAVCFVTGAFTPSDPNKVTVWMGQWSLYAYCFHVMWYRLLGSPYGAIITFASIPAFWAMSRSKDKNASGAQEQQT